MMDLTAVNSAVSGLPRMQGPTDNPFGQAWFDNAWDKVSHFVESIGLAGVFEWLQSLDWRMASLLGAGVTILLLLLAGRVMLRREENRAALSAEQPRLALPRRLDAHDRNWIPDIAGRLGLKARDRQDLLDGIERLRDEMRQLFDQFESGAQANAPPPSAAPMWRRLIERSGDDDARAITEPLATLERTYHALAIIMAAQLLETRALDDRIAALDGQSGTTLKDAIEWWRRTAISDLTSDNHSAGPRVDETARRMAQVVLRAEIVARTYLADEADCLHLASALSSIAGATRHMLARANWSFDRPQLLVWQPSTSMNGIQRSFVVRPERAGGTRGAVTPTKSFYLQFLQRYARDVDSTRSVAVDIVEIGYRAPDQQWEPSRLVAYNPAEWM